MSNEMDLEFDDVIRRAFRTADLPAAPVTLRRTLDDLPRTAAAPRSSLRRWQAAGLLAAGVVVAVVALNGPFGPFGPSGVGPGASQAPSPTPSPSPTPISSTYPAYSVAALLAGHADGTVGGDPVIVFGWYTDLRDVVADPCPSKSSPEPDSSCLQLRQGLVDAEEPVGTVVDGQWTPNPSPALHPMWTTSLVDAPRLKRFFAITGPDQAGRRPIFVLLSGRFFDDRFEVADILQFDDPFAAGTPAPSPTPFASGSLPPPPARMTSCTEPRAPEAAASGDPIPRRLVSEGWVAKEDVPFPFLGAPVAEDMVYFGIVEGDIPLGIWIDDPDGSGRFRWWGTSTCVADTNGIFYGWLPGSTYRIFEDGHRVDGGDPFDPTPTTSPGS